MPESRRRLLIAFVTTLCLSTSKLLLAFPQIQGRTPRARTYPNGRDPNAPVALDEPSRVDPKGIEKANRQKFREDVSRLYEVVSELKQQVDQTDSGVTFSLSLVKKTEEIAKLAKQIKGLAKG